MSQLLRSPVSVISLRTRHAGWALGACLLASSVLGAPSAGAQNATPPPTVVEAICLEGDRPARLCACAEQRMYDRLGPQDYAQYEAGSQAYLTQPKEGWRAAAADVAAITGGATDAILEETKSHGRAHREEMQACAAVTATPRR